MKCDHEFYLLEQKGDAKNPNLWHFTLACQHCDTVLTASALDTGV